jgi:predicted HNH restriction endonuclease
MQWDKERQTEQQKFRSTNKWTIKAKQIKERDHWLCQACLHDVDGNGVRYTRDDLEVHHIESLTACYDKRLDDDNLITLCRAHHEQAEQGVLCTADVLHAIARANRDGWC